MKYQTNKYGNLVIGYYVGDSPNRISLHLVHGVSDVNHKYSYNIDRTCTKITKFKMFPLYG